MPTPEAAGAVVVARVVRAAAAVGEAIAHLHASPLPPGGPLHDGAAELAVIRRWERLAHQYGVLPDRPWDPADLYAG